MKGGGRKENGVANVLRPAPEYASASILTFFHCVVFPRRRQERNKRHIMKNHSVICHNVVVVKGINHRGSFTGVFVVFVFCLSRLWQPRLLIRFIARVTCHLF